MSFKVGRRTYKLPEALAASVWGKIWRPIWTACRPRFIKL
jgi:hypothetical protein